MVGDVTGHDQHAAAVRAQLRNVLRGVAQTLPEPPAAVLSALDAALGRLHVGTLATAVLCQVQQSPQQAGAGQRLLRWSNAGHPPPLLLPPDGTARYLTAPPDLLLGLDPGTARTDSQVLLDDGATLVLYTDGLVERRDQSLDSGLNQLRTTASELRALPVEQLCDALLERLADNDQDDVALLVLRAHPRDAALQQEPATTRAADEQAAR